MTRPALANRACPVCGSHEASAAVSGAADNLDLATLRSFWFGIDKQRCFFAYHRCEGCGLLYNRAFFDDAQLEALYSQMPPNMDLVQADAIAATQRGYFDAAAAGGFLNGDYLEIGPDVGYMAGEAARRGRFDRLWLFEPNLGVHDRLREAAGAASATIVPDMADLSAVPDGSVGLAVMVHVLDHLLDPVAMLAGIRSKLRPNGALLIVTHDEKSGLRRLLGPRWPAFCLQHPQLYNPATIRRLILQSGFAEARVEPSRNYFPIDFLARQAARAAGFRLGALPLPKRTLGLRLGNILTMAIAPDQAAARSSQPDLLESAA